jgi:hypothetical protein
MILHTQKARGKGYNEKRDYVPEKKKWRTRTSRIIGSEKSYDRKIKMYSKTKGERKNYEVGGGGGYN